MKINSFWRSVFLLLILMSAGGLFSAGLGQDINWDLLNYHLYNPFAFFNGKIGHDFMAAGIHSCINPLLDIYFYLLFKLFFNSPRWIAFFMGLPYGILAWASYGLAKALFVKTSLPRGLSAAAAAVGVTAAGVMSQVGTTTNEIPLACISIVSLWMAVLFIQKKKSALWLYGAAFLSGAAAGLKLTASPYCIALFFAVLVQAKTLKHPVKTLCLFVVYGGLGFLLADGYFLWKWYSLYGNPVFPYYNQIFQSPYFDPIYLTETRFFPKTLGQWLFYPFYWAFKPAMLSSEAPVCDMRLALSFIALAMWAVQAWHRKIEAIGGRAAVSIGVYFMVGYVLWLTQFSILRYAAVLEVLSGILLTGVCVLVFKKRYALYAAWGLFGVLALGYESPDWKHGTYLPQAVLFDFKPQIEDNALVFFMHLPSSYLAPLLNPKASYMGGFIYQPEDYPMQEQERAAQRNNIQLQYLRFHFEEAQKNIIAAHSGPIYLIAIDWPELVNLNVLKRFGLEGSLKDCAAFATSWTIYSPRLAVCRVNKIANTEMTEK